MIQKTIYLCSLEQALKMKENNTLRSFIESKEGKDGKYVCEKLHESKERFGVLFLPGRMLYRRIVEDRRCYFFQIGDNIRWTLEHDGRHIQQKIGSQWINVETNSKDDLFNKDIISYPPKIERLCTQLELRKNSRDLRNFISSLVHKIENRTDSGWLQIGNDFLWFYNFIYPHSWKENTIKSYHDGIEVYYSQANRSEVAEGEAERIGKTLR